MIDVGIIAKRLATTMSEELVNAIGLVLFVTPNGVKAVDLSLVASAFGALLGEFIQQAIEDLQAQQFAFITPLVSQRGNNIVTLQFVRVEKIGEESRNIIIPEGTDVQLQKIEKDLPLGLRDVFSPETREMFLPNVD